MDNVIVYDPTMKISPRLSFGVASRPKNVTRFRQNLMGGSGTIVFNDCFVVFEFLSVRVAETATANVQDVSWRSLLLFVRGARASNDV
mgnify:CR=1 FL=1